MKKSKNYKKAIDALFNNPLQQLKKLTIKPKAEWWADEFDYVFHPAICKMGVKKVHVSFTDYEIAKSFIRKVVERERIKIRDIVWSYTAPKEGMGPVNITISEIIKEINKL